jgi:hypothetical protein
MALSNVCDGSSFIALSNSFFALAGSKSSIILSTCSIAKSVALSMTRLEITLNNNNGNIIIS